MEKEFFIQFNSDIAKDDPAVSIELYANIGFFIEVAQMLEFNLRKLICYHQSVISIEKEGITKENVDRICKEQDKYYSNTYKEKYTLGRLKRAVERLKLFKSEVINAFEEINKYRVQVVHFIFQNNIYLESFKRSDYVNEYTQKRLIPMTNKAIAINKMVINIMNTFKTDLHKYKAQVGL